MPCVTAGSSCGGTRPKSNPHHAQTRNTIPLRMVNPRLRGGGWEGSGCVNPCWLLSAEAAPLSTTMISQGGRHIRTSGRAADGPSSPVGLPDVRLNLLERQSAILIDVGRLEVSKEGVHELPECQFAVLLVIGHLEGLGAHDVPDFVERDDSLPVLVEEEKPLGR